MLGLTHLGMIHGSARQSERRVSSRVATRRHGGVTRRHATLWTHRLPRKTQMRAGLTIQSSTKFVRNKRAFSTRGAAHRPRWSFCSPRAAAAQVRPVCTIVRRPCSHVCISSWPRPVPSKVGPAARPATRGVQLSVVPALTCACIPSPARPRNHWAATALAAAAETSRLPPRRFVRPSSTCTMLRRPSSSPLFACRSLVGSAG